MAVSARAIMEFPAPEARQSVAARDAILYALSVGYGAEPLDASHLRRTQERGAYFPAVQPASMISDVPVTTADASLAR